MRIFSMFVVLISISQVALAGFSEIKGRAMGFLEFGDPISPFERQLQLETDQDARRQCPSGEPLRRISPYYLRSKLAPYRGNYIYVRANYICGTSDN